MRKAYELIEDQHKTILDFVASFEKAVQGKEELKSVLALIAQTREFAQFHFTVEESLMQIVKYPEFSAHRTEHQSVLEQLKCIEKRVLRREASSEWLPLLRACLFKHFDESDQRFTQYAIEKSRDVASGPTAERSSWVAEDLAMNAISLHEVVETSHAAMDLEHRNLADFFNLLADGIKNRMGADFCRDIIEEIERTAKAHFAMEQRLMDEAHYPMASQHAGEHAMLTRQLHDFMAEFDVDWSGAHAALVHFVEVWLNFHILFSDKKFAEFLAGNRALNGDSRA